MEYSGYLRLISRKRPALHRCASCASPVFIGSPAEGFCQFCESYVPHTKEGAGTSKFAEIHSMLDAHKTEEARNSLDAITAHSSDPTLLFAAAHFYRIISDYRYYDLDYSRKGFMEENSSNIYASLEMTSKSKEMFYKSLKLASDLMKDSPSEQLLYMNFISYIRLRRVTDAGRVLFSMKPSRNDRILPYAHMLYWVEAEKPGARKEAIAMVEKGNVNAIYHLARCYAREKKLAEAKGILERLTMKVRMPDAVFLLHRIDRLLEETRL